MIEQNLLPNLLIIAPQDQGQLPFIHTLPNTLKFL